MPKGPLIERPLQDSACIEKSGLWEAPQAAIPDGRTAVRPYTLIAVSGSAPQSVFNVSRGPTTKTKQMAPIAAIPPATTNGNTKDPEA